VKATPDSRLFGLLVTFWIVGSPVWFWAIPNLVWQQPDLAPGGRFSLVAAWVTLVLTGVAITNTWYYARGMRPLDLITPPAATSALRVAALGVAAIELGFIIATTVFK
jgi:hypothetical protein